MAANYHTEEARLLGQLKELTSSPGFIYTLAQATLESAFIAPEDATNPHSRLNVKELTLTADLMVMGTLDIAYVPSEEELAVQAEKLDSLLEKIHQVAVEPMKEGTLKRSETLDQMEADESDMNILRPHARELVEPFFYVGTGAYDFQYLDLARKKYVHDTNWLVTNVGLSVDQLTEVATKLQCLRESRLRDVLLASTYEAWCGEVLAALLFKRNDLDFLTERQFDAFIERFALTPGEVGHQIDSIGAVNELEFRPIICLGKGLYLMPVPFKLAQSIYESPFYWMWEDQNYRGKATNNRGRVTEEIAAHLLQPVFGSQLYRNVRVQDKRGDITDIDLLAVMGNRALVVQAKAKRLTALSRQGDNGRLQTDFKQAIQDAYDQGLTSRNALLNPENFSLSIQGQPVDFPCPIDEVYLICLTLDHFPALPYVTDRFLTRQIGDPYPLAMSVFDLDALHTYLDDPFDFLHYVDQRVRFSRRVYGSCEMAFLATYLESGLTLSDIHDILVIGEDAIGKVDQDFPTRRGRNKYIADILGTPPSISDAITLKNRWEESRFQHTIKILKGSPDPEAIDALFMIYDFPVKSSERVLHEIEEAQRACAKTGESNARTILLAESSGLSYICFPNLNLNFNDILRNHAEATKYKYKAGRWLGLAGTLSEPVVGVSHEKNAWEANSELDDLARSIFQPDSPRKPGRNDPCWCGSGEKYKRCHLWGPQTCHPALTQPKQMSYRPHIDQSPGGAAR